MTNRDTADIWTICLTVFFGSQFIAVFFFHSAETGFWIFKAGVSFVFLWLAAGAVSKVWGWLKERYR